jgi:hypothetical protein
MVPMTSLRRKRRRREPLEISILGGYVTDGHRLFRVVSWFAAGRRDELVALEDCATLEVRPFLPRELDTMGLRAVASNL